MLRRIVVMLCPLVMVAGCGPQPGTDAGGPEPAGQASTVVSPRATPNGAPLTGYQGRWWTWAAAEPSASNPVEDLTGEDCARNQPDDVWFLAGTFGGEVQRRCSVPEGRPILFPIVNRFSTEPGDCAGFIQVATGSASLDGQELPVDRIEAETALISAAPDNALDLYPEPFEATACGLWAELAPLPAGRHELQIRGRAGSFVVSVDYVLDVIAG